MAPAGYFSCLGCGQLFHRTEEGTVEYEAHDCDEHCTESDEEQ